MNLSAVHRLPLTPLTGRWFRAVPPVYWPRVANARYTRRVHSRFSPGKDGNPPFEILYFGETAEVISLECSLLFFDRRLNHSFPNPDAGTHLIVASEIVLQQIADLTNAESLACLETNVQELTGDWTIYNSVKHRPHLASLPTLAPTQQLGQRLFSDPRIEGFKVFSAKKPECLSLVIFPEKLLAGSSLSFLNDPLPSKIIVGKR
ncbi:MAG TPA: hypothetical protein VFW87_27330 [Pirellulales bacterium]|nr:hypothetical protein [Pirellulales bacterium]